MIAQIMKGDVLMRKVSFITGAGGYIGGQIARTLAARGDYVAVCDIKEEFAMKTVNFIRENGGEAFALAFDVADPKQVDEAIQMTVKKYERLDVLVHAAGGSARLGGPGATFRDLVEQEDRVIDAVLKVNLYGALYTSRAAAKQMISQGGGGYIIHISSSIGLNGLKGRVEYAAAKGGVIAMAKAFAKEVGKYRITVNTVAPGCIGNDTVPDDAPEMINTNFLGRRGNAEDIAYMVDFLSSGKADFITGQTCVVDGGRSLGMKGSD